jgi:hypothetical protein
VVREKYERLKAHLGERGRRLWAANEALSFGSGGIRAVAEALQTSSMTILQGKRELPAEPSRADSAVVGRRQRRPGGGRKSTVERYPQLISAMERIVDPATRGDPMAPLSSRHRAAGMRQRPAADVHISGPWRHGSRR